MCTGREKLTAEGTEFEGQLQYVSDAVMAFANAFKYVSKYDPVTFYNVEFFFFFFFPLSLRFLLKKKKNETRWLPNPVPSFIAMQIASASLKNRHIRELTLPLKLP